MDALRSQIYWLKTRENTSPIDRLPVEILIEIFVYCAHETALTPIILGRICRRWEEITNFSPRIFQWIVLDDSQVTTERSTGLSQTFLLRSRSLQFDVDISISNRDNVLPFLSPFLPHLNRWRSCTIEGNRVEHVHFREFWTAGTGEPRLEQLDISVDPGQQALVGGQVSTEDQIIFHTFKSHPTPLKSNLLFMDVSLSRLPLALFEPLRFVSLFIQEKPTSPFVLKIHPIDFLQFLTACPVLEFLSFTGSMFQAAIRPEDFERPPPVPFLPRLRSLVLHSTLCTRTILSYIDTPNLKELYLEHLNVDFSFPIYNLYSSHGDSDDEGDFSQSPYSDHATGMGLRSLFQRCDPPLRVLEMDYADMRTKDFRWLFERASSLEEFRIVASDMADCVVQMLSPWTTPCGTPRYRCSVALPQLKSLELYNCQRLSGKAIVSALRSRVVATDDAVGRGVFDGSSMDDVAIVGCANFINDHEIELSDALGDRLRFN
ncbi:hypothetical protein HETIRDRAFT_317718 [Heterobasidion irregulare TC 32-1]|uniref:F-box domain-containing protein n=1 Tax=Heterobasidion irregulare (strain TC 32-1) TaxID=747525 RepID=W4K8T2_HETIT|nr:uncharacterized protein HETIRDRAFT_317718 [Heterobasidion irregulare TC 32-1]ETW81755.1 hypothetical protein HETIRDRAFT_317718 [Heterobasidion irregulare TC 32-1]